LSKARRSSSKGKANQDSSSPDSSGNPDIDDDLLLSSVSADPESPILGKAPSLRRSNSGDTSDSSTPIEGEFDVSEGRSDSLTSRNRSLSFGIAEVVPLDVRENLQYAKENLTAAFYNLPVDGMNFVQTGLCENALKFEPLLYAVVCFAAYHRTLRRPDGEIKHFLGYHTKSIKLLHYSLKKSQKHTYLTLLTILQLATIEVSIIRLHNGSY
jgi:hypothetical protein